jgi:uncharacterized membrane protein YccC
MTTPSSAPNTPNAAWSLPSLYAACADWARTDGRNWIYILKALTAAFLAIGIAMKLEMPQPRTAMTTVFIVMQPQSGAVFAKSFYRICGTLVGLVVMLALLGLFPQQPELFILSTALWVGICTAGAARNRNFRSYGFVLAGYTAALIGIPASQHPDGALLSALTRVSEVLLGIVCAGAVSALLFPEHTGELMRTTVRARFSSFVDYVGNVLGGRIERAQIEETNARFIADIVGLEAMRSMAVFESPESRMRGGRLARLNTEFMAASTRFHALHQLMNRLHMQSAWVTIDALEPYFREIAPLLHCASGEPVRTAADATHSAKQLEAYQAELPRRIRATRAGLAVHPDEPLLDFDTASELLYRFVEDLHAYTATYASLAVPTHARERWIEHYEPKTNPLTAGISGVRAVIVMCVLGAFWIATAWPSGTTLTLNAAATCALASMSPNPPRMAWQMAVGTTLSSVMAMILTFGIYPHIDGFPLLCAALTPFLAFGVFMTTRPKLAGYGVGYCIFFCFLAGPDNLELYEPMSFMNDALALVLSILVTAVAVAVLLPPSTPWLRNRLLIDLRRQVVAGCRGPVRGLRTRFESGARDLMFQINALAANEPEVKRITLRWLFAVLEVGNAITDLRREIEDLPRDPRYARMAPWRVKLRTMRDEVGRLFETPTAKRLDTALAATGDAIDAVQQMLAQVEPVREERHRMQRILSHAHFVRSALLDPQSPLAELNGNGAGHPPPGARHAS